METKHAATFLLTWANFLDSITKFRMSTTPWMIFLAKDIKKLMDEIFGQKQNLEITITANFVLSAC